MTADRRIALAETESQVTLDWLPPDEALKMVAAIAGPDFYQFSKSFLGGIRSVKLSERERVRRAVGGDDALRVLAVLWWETNSGKRQFRGFLEDDGDTIYGINIKPIAKKAGLTRKKTGHVLNAVALSCIIANGEDEE